MNALNGTGRRTIFRLFESDTNHDDIAFKDAGRDVSWHAFGERVGRLVELLAGRPENTWAVCCENSLHFATSLFALWLSGKVPVFPKNYQVGTLQRIRGIVDAVLRDTPALEQFPSIDVTQVKGAALRGAQISSTAHAIFFTSGSTAEPKQVIKTAGHIQAELSVLDELWGDAIRGSLVVSSVPCRHFYGNVFGLLLPLVSGGIIDTSLWDPISMIRSCGGPRSVTWVSSPATLGRLPDVVAVESLKPGLKLVFSAGGPLPIAVPEEFRRALDFVPTEIYGSTETGAIAWRRQPCDGLWTVLPGVEVEQGDEGCIRVRSPFLTDGNWLPLGDRIQLRQQNRFELVGRVDRFVKIEERLLSLPDMEARLRENSWLLDAAVTTVDLPQPRRTIIAAAIILNDQGRDELKRQGPRGFAKSLKKHLAQWFEPVLLPRRWRYPEKFPVNELGKLPADALQRLFLDGAE